MNNSIEINYMSGNELTNMNTNKLETIIYNSFISLVKYKQLKHNKKEIHRLCNSNSSFFISATIDNVLIGYILGEYIHLNDLNSIDRRYVGYITYVHIVDDYRNKGIASKMMKILMELQKNDVKNNIDGILLTFDTRNKKLMKFYKKLGFVEDILFRTYDRFEIFYKHL